MTAREVGLDPGGARLACARELYHCDRERYVLLCAAAPRKLFLIILGGRTSFVLKAHRDLPRPSPCYLVHRFSPRARKGTPVSR